MTTTTKDRPIIMSAESVRAILDGRKTQTRRVVKPQPAWNAELEVWVWPNALHGYASCYPTDGLIDWLTEHSPYPIGSRLWVRETWQYYDWTEDGIPYIRYQADGASLIREDVPDDWLDRVEDAWATLSDPANYDIEGRASDKTWRSPIYMPRWASRITLEVTGVRAERVQDIDNCGAIAEGVPPPRMEPCGAESHDSVQVYLEWWDKLNPKHPWASNPWVWVVEFAVAGGDR